MSNLKFDIHQENNNIFILVEDFSQDVIENTHIDNEIFHKNFISIDDGNWENHNQWKCIGFDNINNMIKFLNSINIFQC